ncbi:hypothetical protein YC2023_122654 [Brassica napus]
MFDCSQSFTMVQQLRLLLMEGETMRIMYELWFANHKVDVFFLKSCPHIREND